MFFEEEGKFADACGVFGYYSFSGNEPIGQYAYYSLFALQHRGQDSCGIYVSKKGSIYGKKAQGLVSKVFTNSAKLRKFDGKIGIGHVRYGTSGSNGVLNAQPMIGNTRYGKLAIAHNGHIINDKHIREKLTNKGTIFQSESDSEAFLNLIARSNNKTLRGAIINSLEKIKGSYSLIFMTHDKLFAVRDPHGIRPLVMGEKDGDIVFCSETSALETIGAKYVKDVEPGELIEVSKNKTKSYKITTEKHRKSHCSFEYIYFARNDSEIDNISTYKSRIKLGIELAKESSVDADIVIGIPDSGITSAIGFSEETGITYGEGFVKNRYVQRTFISPTQKLREQSVKVKLNALSATVNNKRVVVIDDSIVRGTTSGNLVKLLKESGATEVHFRVASPKVVMPCYFGINTPTKEELIANRMTVEQIRDYIEADSLHFLSIDGMLKATKGTKNNRCWGCFNKKGYPFNVEKYV